MDNVKLNNFNLLKRKKLRNLASKAKNWTAKTGDQNI